MRTQTILITGANGFLGKTIVATLQKEYPLHCIVRDKTYTNTKAKVTYFTCYTDEPIASAVAQSDVIIHLAGMLHGSEQDLALANIAFTRKLVTLAQKYNLQHFIYISTESIRQPHKNLYALSKIAAEKEVRKFKNHLILRPTVVYGPGDTKYVTKLIRFILYSPIIPILGNGTNTFQFLHVTDLTTIIHNAIKKKIFGTYFIAGPKPITYNAFIQLLLQELHIQKHTIHIPLILLQPLAHILNSIFRTPPLTPNQVESLRTHRSHDTKTIAKIFKYTPTPLESGIRQLIAKEFSHGKNNS